MVPEVEPDDPSSWRKAAKILTQGGMAVLPTDTVYGLCASANNKAAVARVFAAKHRSDHKGLIVLVADNPMARTLVDMDERGRSVARRFWPGPLTIVFPALPGNGLAQGVQAGLPTLALRCPALTDLRELVAQTGPIVATSANVSGNGEVHSVAELDPAIAEAADIVVDGGEAKETWSSTLLDMSGECPHILRQGALAREFLARELNDLAH